MMATSTENSTETWDQFLAYNITNTTDLGVVQEAVFEPIRLQWNEWTANASVMNMTFADDNSSVFNYSVTPKQWGHFNDMEPFLITVVTMSVLLTFLIVATIVGNLFVIAAILLEKNLQTVGNYLVLSLAVADLMVACLVMPLGAVYEVRREWIMGALLCEIWTSGDVLLCTASILHLLAIALDRFYAVTNVDYIRHRSNRRIGTMILLVWAVGFLVSIAPIFGWKDDDFLHRIETEKRCLVSQDTGYQVFATCSAFYVPLVLILILYWRIYQVARKRIRHKPGSNCSAVQPKQPKVSVIEHTEISVITDGKSLANATGSSSNVTSTNGSTKIALQQQNVSRQVPKKKKPTRESVEAKRERKAAKTLAIITGVFVMCWLPFFVTALLMAVCGAQCEPNPYLFSFFLWLGYANSMLNPIIYTIFSPDFRMAFKKRILCGRRNRPGMR